MSLKLTVREQLALRRGANKAIWEAAYYNVLPTDEVSWLKNLVNIGVPLIDQSWKKVFHGSGLSVGLTGVVCHGRPYVKTAVSPPDCELGDFLLVHDHQPISGALQRRAVIVQAKVFKDHTGVTSKNGIQLALYQNWLPFTYSSWPGGIAVLENHLETHGLPRSNSGAHLQRDLFHTSATTRTSPSNVDAGGRYGMVEVDFEKSLYSTNYRRPPWRICGPHDPPSVYTTSSGFRLGTYLARLVRGEAGRDAPETAWPSSFSSACHWSLVVQELMSLTVTAAPVAPRLAALSAAIPVSPKPPRGPPEPPFKDERKEDGGFGIVVVRTSGSPERRRLD